jgi:hypothetical protein
VGRTANGWEWSSPPSRSDEQEEHPQHDGRREQDQQRERLAHSIRGGTLAGTSRRRGRSALHQLVEQHAGASVDLLDDGPDLLDGLAGGVGEVPVEVALARVDRTGVTAAHGDDDVGAASRLVGERLGELLGHVEPAFGEDLGDRGVDLLAGGGAGGAHDDPAVAVVVEQHPGSDGAAGVVGADHEDLGDVGHECSLGADDGAEAVGGEPLGE